MQTKFISFLSLFLLIPAISFGEGKRTELESEYPFVGQIQKNGIGGCTGFLLKHGVLATAKHCFTNYDINPLNFNAKEFSLVFPQKDMLGIVQDYKVEGKDIIKLHLDSGTNDLAYILYKKEATEGKIDIQKYKVNLTDDIEKDSQVFRIGYPQSSKTPRGSVRTLTHNCGFTGKTDFMAPTLSSETYDGLLYDTNCPAWMGDSGGPIFTEVEMDGKKELTLQGVLAHTFEIGFDGQVNADAMKEDEIGKYARSSNYSPMLLAEDYELVLDEASRLNGEEEEKKIPIARQLKNQIQTLLTIIQMLQIVLILKHQL